MISVLLFLFTGAVLLVAVYLEPDAQGHGTHMQLGLSQCSVLDWTGYPCPMCGMTTSFALMVRVRVLEAVVAQPMGVVFFLGTFIVFWVALLEGARPRLRWAKIWRAVVRIEGRIVIGFVVGLLSGWVYKAWSMGLLDEFFRSAP